MKLEQLTEIDDNIVHASATRALAYEIVYYAKRIAEHNNIDLSDPHQAKVWEGIMARQLSNAKQALEDYVNEARVDAEYRARGEEND